MNRLAKTTGRSAAWIVAGIVLALSVMGAGSRTAHAVPGTAYIYRGIALEPQWCWNWSQFPGWNGCWHDDEAGTYTAVDFNWGSGNEDAWKLVQLWFTGSQQYVTYSALSGGSCTGLRAVFYHDSGRTMYAGELHYLHINPYAGVIGSTNIYNARDHYYRDLGEVAGTQPSGCAWDGAHLHQSANTDASTAFFTNKFQDPTVQWALKVCSSAC